MKKFKKRSLAILWLITASALRADPAPVMVRSAVKPIQPAESMRSCLPRSAAAGVLTANVHLWLAPLNRQALKAEDVRRAADKDNLRIGVVRDLPAVTLFNAASNRGRWTDLSDGAHVWQLVIEVPGAFGVRVHLNEISLPSGCELAVFSTYEPAHWRGPYSTGTLQSRHEFWAGTVFAETITVECYCPPGPIWQDVTMAVDKIVDVYRNPLAPEMEGPCNNDVTCYAAWTNAASGVAGIGSLQMPNYIWCTGCLLNDRDPASFIDYFMTANHCVANQAEAADTEFYWFYQTATCNGSPPNPSTVPHTGGGADFLAGRSSSVANDFALLRLRTASPGGVTYAGWTTGELAVSNILTCIHHPDGSYKRISFGHLEDSTTNYWFVHWTNGVTEAGSSGSPLFDAQTNFVGQLRGGASSCDNPDGIDDYGRFNVSYPSVSAWLAAETNAYAMQLVGGVQLNGAGAVISLIAGVPIAGSFNVFLFGSGTNVAVLHTVAVGLRNSYGQWVGGAPVISPDLQQMFASATGTLYSGCTFAALGTAGLAPGAYSLWLYDDPSASNPAAIQGFKDAVPAGETATHKIAGTLIILDDTPSMLGLEAVSGDSVLIRWNSFSNRIYATHFATNLLTGFSILSNNIPATPPENAYTDTLQNLPQGFWKITMEPSP